MELPDQKIKIQTRGTRASEAPVELPVVKKGHGPPSAAQIQCRDWSKLSHEEKNGLPSYRPTQLWLGSSATDQKITCHETETMAPIRTNTTTATDLEEFQQINIYSANPSAAWFHFVPKFLFFRRSVFSKRFSSKPRVQILNRFFTVDFLASRSSKLDPILIGLHGRR